MSLINTLTLLSNCDRNRIPFTISISFRIYVGVQHLILTGFYLFILTTFSNYLLRQLLFLAGFYKWKLWLKRKGDLRFVILEEMRCQVEIYVLIIEPSLSGMGTKVGVYTYETLL